MTYAKDFLDRARAIKSNDGIDLSLLRTKGAMVSSAIGAGVGLVIGVTHKYNLLICSFLGALVGGAVASHFIPKS